MRFIVYSLQPCFAFKLSIRFVPIFRIHVQLATPGDTFTALSHQFNFDPRTKDKIIELGIRTLDELRHYARSE